MTEAQKLELAIKALKMIKKKQPMKVGRAEAADMAVEFHSLASKTLYIIEEMQAGQERTDG